MRIDVESDISIGKECGEGYNQQLLDPAFRNSRWFARGWTLQELLAPNSVEFFSREGIRLGDKESLVHEIHKITGISVSALQGKHLSQFGVDERMSWIESRKTKKPEDCAYSFLGILNVSMAVLDGEGRKQAFRRLENEVDNFAASEETDESPPWTAPFLACGCGTTYAPNSVPGQCQCDLLKLQLWWHKKPQKFPLRIF